ncbi:glycogen synthase [Rubrivirga sp. IMCC43871]|uniref:glycogen synthase n=1 Tax=Rubrivirga sp. IMCC43871 TaxID=3391575 RepID=UPI00398FA2F1
MPVLHVSAECTPFAKVGGLADVVGALPHALSRGGVAAAVVMPFYGGPEGRLAQKAGVLASVHTGVVHFEGEWFPFEVFRSQAMSGDGAEVPLYLVHEPEHFGDDGVYFRDVDKAWFERGDVRYLVFQLMVLDWLRSEHTPLDGADVLHLHDHHGGLIPALLANDPANAPIRDVPTVFTVHSADHHGEIAWTRWANVGVAVPNHASLDHLGRVNSLKAGVEHADRVTTVSPTYARELAASPEPSHGLDYAFRLAHDRLSGIVNGVDQALWDPATDPHLPAGFSADDLGGKAATKRAVCADLGLDAARPLLVFVGRLTPEKGAAVLAEGLAQILDQTDAAIAVLGSGYDEHEDALRQLGGAVPADRFSLTLAFDEALAHRLYGAGDFFLMPSKQEPCGLGQLYAMRYGTVPIVHAVGGLRDTVVPWDGAEGTGVWFEAFTGDAFADAVARALALDADALGRVQRTGMRADHSWASSALAYAALYDALR